jgi:hypothetical protein
LAKDFDDFMVSSFKNIIGSILLIGCDKLRLKGGFHGFEFLKIRFELMQQSGFQNLCSFAGFIEIQIRYIPTGDFNIIGIDQRDQILNGNKDIFQFVVLESHSDPSGGTLGETAEIISLFHS